MRCRSGLGPLESEAAERALRLPAAELGVDYTAKAIEVILAGSGGYPYFLQEWGKAAWDAAADRQIDEAAIAVAAAEVAEELDEEFFGLRVGRTTAAELELCRALASLGEGPQPIREVAQGMGRELRSLSPTRAGVDSKGPDLPHRARADRVHRPTLRALHGAQLQGLIAALAVAGQEPVDPASMTPWAAAGSETETGHHQPVISRTNSN